MSEHNAETQPDCRCPVPNRPTGREPEQLPPWECLTCGGYACEYADQSKARCPEWRCDCFIAQFPDSPRDLHPEVFIVGAIAPPDTPCPNCSHARGLHHDYLDEKPLRAEGYDEDVLMAVVTARTRLGLNRKMRREEKRHGLPRNGVLS